MSTALIWRLVWKDARILMPAWLAVVGLAVVMQFCCVILGLMDGVRPDMGNMLSCVLGGFFPLVIALGAIQFAGEVEEDTASWLRQLPISPWWIAATKLVTPIAVFLLYAAAGTLTGLVISRFRWPDSLALSESVVSFTMLLCLFACTAFFSLQMKKVIPAAAVGMLFAAYLMIQIFLAMGPVADAVELRMLTSITNTLLAVDFAIAVRWARGRSVRPTLSWLRGSRRELPNVWQPVLQWSVARRDPVLRATAALAWRELRGISVFVVIWGLVGWVFVNGAFMALRELNGVGIWYMLLTPLFAGVVAYMNDQSRESQLFMGQRGVSPSLVWITRNTLWFSAAFVLVLGWSLWDRYGLHPNEEPKESSRYAHQSVFQIVDEVRVHYPAMGMRPYPPASAEDIALQASLVGSLLLGFFALGGVCGMWAGRPITAFLASFILGLLLFLWHLLALAALVPLWLITWPLAILWLAATWRGSELWLVGRSMKWRPLFAWLFIPCVFVVAAFPIARRYQIPAVDVSLDEIEEKWTVSNTQHAEEWEKLRQILRRKGGVPWEDDRGAAQAFMEQAHVIATREPVGPWSLTPEQMVIAGEMRPSQTGLVTRFDWGHTRPSYGRVLRSEGKLREEMSLYLDLLGVLDRIRPIQYLQIEWLREEQMIVLRNIADCANQPECDLETLQFALDTLRMESGLGHRLGRVDPGDTMINDTREAEIVVARQLLHEEGPFFKAYDRYSWQSDYYRQPSDTQRPPPDWLLSLYAWTGEHARYDRLAAAVLAESDPDSGVRSEDVLAWLRVTPWLTKEAHELGIVEEVEYRERAEFLNRVDPLIRRWERELPAAHRLTLLTVALQIYHREQGEFPEQLSQLRDISDWEFDVPGDPCTVPPQGGEEGEFLWFPHGLDALYAHGDGHFVRSGQPLLLSVGRSRSALRQEGPYSNSTIIGVPSAHIYVDNALDSRDAADDFVAPRSTGPWIFRILPGRPDIVASSIMGGQWVAGAEHVDSLTVAEFQ